MPVGCVADRLWTPPRQSHPGGVRSGCPTRDTVQVDVGRKQPAAVSDLDAPGHRGAQVVSLATDVKVLKAVVAYLIEDTLYGL